MREYMTCLKNSLQDRWVIAGGVAGAFVGTWQYFQNIPQSSKEANAAIAVVSTTYLVGIGISLYRDSRRNNADLIVPAELNPSDINPVTENLTDGFEDFNWKN